MDVTFEDGTTEQYKDTPFNKGGQAKLYASLDGEHVVKLYKPEKKDIFHIERLQKLINDFNPTKDDPYWVEYFAWPDKIVIKPRVGFRMRYVPLKPMEKYLPFYYPDTFIDLKPEERGWFIGRIATAIKFACAANLLASLGLCYSDFSTKNVLVEPFEGRMTLIDCDSLFVPDRLSSIINGTGDIRAPELYRGDVKTPSPKTDRHALAVVLYLWLVGYHPLNGDKVYSVDVTDEGENDQQDMLRYGNEALYIEHPKDHSNHLENQRITAHVLGGELKKLFDDAFIKGLHNPNERPHPYQWQRALINSYDHIIPCLSPYCDWHFFVVPSSLRRLTCPYCLQPVKYPRTLPVVSLQHHSGRSDPEDYDGKQVHSIIGWPGRQLHEWHIYSHHSPIPGKNTPRPDMTPLAFFEYDSRKRCWYLHNSKLPDMRFRFTRDPSGTWRRWPLHTSIALNTGIIIQFGNTPEYSRASITLEEID